MITGEWNASLTQTVALSWFGLEYSRQPPWTNSQASRSYIIFEPSTYTTRGYSRKDSKFDRDANEQVEFYIGYMAKAPGDSAERVLARLAWRVDIPSSSTFFDLTKPRNHLHHPKTTAREKTAS